MHTTHAPDAEKNHVARAIADGMALIAYPDSRFGRDFSQFIPGFDGADLAALATMSLPACRAARRVFITPDNAVAPLRRMLIEAGADLIVPSYGLYRGFLHVPASAVPPDALPYCGWLDAIEAFGTALTLDELSALATIDLIITGSSAITMQGLRFGMGDFYLDIEWAILRMLGLVDERTPVIAVVHDTEVAARSFAPAPSNVCANTIVTPTRIISILEEYAAKRPATLDRSIVPHALEAMPFVQAFTARFPAS